MNGRLRELGEFGFIERVANLFSSHLPDDVLGIGDDCAVIPGKKETSVLVTTDSLIEGVHFLRSAISPRDLGYKSLAVNLSDIAAMGGTPGEAFLSMGVGKDTEVSFLDQFLEGFHELCDETGTGLLGGDTTGSPGPLFINVNVIGTAPPGRVRLRSMARPLDAVCVTGCLGDSGGGLNVLLRKLSKEDPDNAYLIGRHHRPRPHLQEGMWLAEQEPVHAMMDVSDGIDSDCRRIAERSRCGVDIRLESLPISGPLQRVAGKNGWNLFEIAAAAGEDYCLLVTIDPAGLRDVCERFHERFGQTLVEIGRVSEAPNRIRYFHDGKEVRLDARGFDHFRREEDRYER